MDWAVFDKSGKCLAGPYGEADDAEVRTKQEARQFPQEAGAWAGPVCDWHPRVPRESCPGFPHE